MDSRPYIEVVATLLYAMSVAMAAAAFLVIVWLPVWSLALWTPGGLVSILLWDAGARARGCAAALG